MIRIYGSVDSESISKRAHEKVERAPIHFTRGRTKKGWRKKVGRKVALNLQPHEADKQVGQSSSAAECRASENKPRSRISIPRPLSLPVNETKDTRDKT